MGNAAEVIVQKFNTWALPVFLNQKNKYWMILVWTLIVTPTYLIPNHFNLYEPVLLEFSIIDDLVPFVPNSFWVYMSEFAMYVVAYIMAKDMVNTNKFLYAFFGLFAICAVIFLVWPTTFPRELYPLTMETNWLTRTSFEYFRILDKPANCVPSLHVASTYLTSFIFLGEQKEKFKYFFGWATLIAISTMTTKQHYFVDVVSGFGLSILIYWIFFKLMPYKTDHEAA